MTDDETGPLPVLEVDADAAMEIKAHGGRVYVWADSAGMKHVRYEAPQRFAEREWMRLDADDVRIFVDRAIQPPAKWVIALRHIPYRHVTALYNGYVPGSGAAGMSAPHHIER